MRRDSKPVILSCQNSGGNWLTIKMARDEPLRGEWGIGGVLGHFETVLHFLGFGSITLGFEIPSEIGDVADVPDEEV